MGISGRVRPADTGRWASWVVLAAAATAVTVLSFVPMHYVERMPIGSTGGHVMAYACLAVLTFAGGGSQLRWMTAIAGLVAMGIAIELVQPAFHRSADVLDAMANCAGITAGMLAMMALERVRRAFRPDEGQLLDSRIRGTQT